jgi:REP element-mobilizing transposase RayT
MARQRHWVNRGEGGDCVFVTTTVLDFVHAFRREEPKDAMVRSILLECRRAQAKLHAYVAMPNHVHLLLRLPEGMTSRQFMHKLKRNASAKIRPLLTPAELAEFSDQTGLNGNTFWQRSFRSFLVHTPEVFWQKVRYVHLNPVRAGYVESAPDYLWSSARHWEAGWWSEEVGLNLSHLVGGNV